MTVEDFNRLPEAAWEFRERRIWDFTEGDVVQIALRQGGQARQMVRNGLNKWSLAAANRASINPPAIEETAATGWGNLNVAGWVGRNVTEPEKFGLNTNNLQIVRERENSAKYAVDFGAEIPKAQTALAAVTLDGERWAFFSAGAVSVRLELSHRSGEHSVIRLATRFLAKMPHRLSLVSHHRAFCGARAGLRPGLVNRIGLPDFLKRRLVETLQRGHRTQNHPDAPEPGPRTRVPRLKTSASATRGAPGDPAFSVDEALTTLELSETMLGRAQLVVSFLHNMRKPLFAVQRKQTQDLPIAAVSSWMCIR